MSNDEIHPLLARLSSDDEHHRRFGQGVVLPARAAKFLLTNPSLWLWAVLPAIVNIALFGLVATALIFNATSLLEWLWAQPDIAAWYDWLLRTVWYLVFAVFVAGSLVVSYYLVLLVGGAVASPFNDKLSEETERILDPSIADARADEPLAAGLARSALASLAHLVVYLVGLAVLLPLHLIPGIGSMLFTATAACWSAAFLAIEYTEDTLDRRGFELTDKFRSLRRDFGLAAGFGAGTSLLMVVPVLNLLAMPVAVVAGAVLGLALRRPDNAS